MPTGLEGIIMEEVTLVLRAERGDTSVDPEDRLESNERSMLKIRPAQSVLSATLKATINK